MSQYANDLVLQDVARALIGALAEEAQATSREMAKAVAALGSEAPEAGKPAARYAIATYVWGLAGLQC